ncbi:MOXD1 homolog 1 [Sitodiplosis mosellana]|uniref:MOXD1 homolog 1 n=1 Tax=Sitodiplosis mosellana TaxID=263140 RepID=UPI002444883E|nr:MOXD1 homolog 1 [Sitodiplosis mosellana]
MCGGNSVVVRWIVSVVPVFFVLCIQLEPVFSNHVHNHHNSHGGQHSKWFRTEILDGNGLFVLDWKKTPKDIIFRATVNTRGYVGLGFSYKSEKIGESDIILAWIDDRTGEPNVLDCHGTGGDNTIPVQDDTQNVLAEEGYQNGTHTQIVFRRPLETCDPHDVTITGNTMKLLWTYNDKDPVYGHLKWHGTFSGVRSIHMLTPLWKKPSPSHNANNRDTRQWDVTVKNITIETDMDTLYWCKILKAPVLQDKHHIIGYEALLTKENQTKKPLVHHMTLFECSTSAYPSSDPLSWDIWVKSSGAVCNSNLLTPRDWDACITPVAVWTISSTGQYLPHHVGIPFGGRDGPKYYMLEIHYDNPKAKRIIDHSGFRIHYTRHLRKVDGGMMISGVSVSDTQLIPPRQKLYRNVGICGPSCTSTMFPETGIKIISATLHSHVAGRKMKLRHVRNGVELDRIIEDDTYDFNYQQVRQLENETTILPGDYLITDCAYETLNRKRPTFGGYSTKQEMCLSFITYYPKIDLAGCYSMTPVKEFFEIFGVYEFYSMNMTDVENLFLYNGNALDLLPTTVFPNFPPGGHIDDENNQKAIEALKNAKEYTIVTEEDALQQESILNKLIISDPVEYHDRSFMAHLNQLPWTEPLFTRRVEQTVLTGKHMTFCRVSNESISVAAEIIRYPNFTALVKEASHCPYHYFMDNLQAAQSIARSTRMLDNSFMLSTLSVCISTFTTWIISHLSAASSH